MRPVCAKCRVEMLCKKNGFMVYTSTYGLSGDLYRCPKCDSQVVVGYGRPVFGDRLSAVASLGDGEGLVLEDQDG